MIGSNEPHSPTAKNDELFWNAANNIHTLITHDGGTGNWRDNVIDVLRATWMLGYDEGQASDA